MQSLAAIWDRVCRRRMVTRLQVPLCTIPASKRHQQSILSQCPHLTQFSSKNRRLGSSIQTRRHGPSPAPESPRPTVWVAPENHVSKRIPGLLVLLVWDPILRRWALRVPGMVDRWAGLGGRHLLPNPDEQARASV